MAKNDEQSQDLLSEEMQAGGETQTDLGAPTAEEAAAEAKDTRVWKIGETEVSKSEFIRDQFTNGNKSRKAISDEFEINYRTVYGATVNMVNEAEPATRGRTASASKINVTADGHVITKIEDVLHVDNVAVADDDAVANAETTEVDRNTWIKEQVDAGRDRSEVAKALGLSYGVVYGMTKEIEGNKQRHTVTHNGEEISRSEFIRRRHAEGVSRSEIAKELGVDYPVVWSALKGLKSEDDKFLDAVDRVAKFADKVEDVAGFGTLIDLLKAVKLKEEAAPADAPADSVYAEQPAQ